MAAAPLRLLLPSAAIVIAAALMPAAAADAAPAHGVTAVVAHRDVTGPVRREAAIDAAPRRGSVADGQVADLPTQEPPLWLLGLLVPILLGGALGIGVTLHRVR